MVFGIFQFIGSILTWILLKILTDFRIIGTENLEKIKRPVIIVSNHEAHLDPQLIGVSLFRRPDLLPLRYMAKDAMFSIPLYNLLIWLLGAFRAHKKEGINRSLQIPTSILQNKGVVIMFPEGRMIVERGTLGSPRRGAAMLALRTGAQILPMAVNTPHDIWPIPLVFDRPRVVVTIGEPFVLDKTKFSGEDEATVNKAGEFIMQKIHHLYSQHKY